MKSGPAPKARLASSRERASALATSDAATSAPRTCASIAPRNSWSAAAPMSAASTSALRRGVAHVGAARLIRARAVGRPSADGSIICRTHVSATSRGARRPAPSGGEADAVLISAAPLARPHIGTTSAASRPAPRKAVSVHDDEKAQK
jgi:hypothetical protein